MKIYGITMMRDEEDVAEHVIRHMISQNLHGIIVADNNSVDGTKAAVQRAFDAAPPGLDLVLIDDPDVAYYQSLKMTRLANLAHERGADGIVPFDADELWYSTHLDIPNAFKKADGRVLEATMFNHFPSAEDPEDAIPFKRLVYREPQANFLPKCAGIWQPGMVIEQGNHSIAAPFPLKHVNSLLRIRHFPYRSWEQFKRKARNGLEAYRATELPPEIGAHWRQYGMLLETEGEDAVRREVYEKYFWFDDPISKGLMRDPAPFCQ